MTVTARKAVEVPSKEADWSFTGGSTACLALWPHIKPGQRAEDVPADVKASHGYLGIMFGLAKVDPKRPCWTVPKIVPGAGGLLHWSERRRLTIGEVKRMASFPDEVKLSGDYEAAWGQVGNCVPPFFMAAVAAAVRVTVGK